jgi:hypothetical protein
MISRGFESLKTTICDLGHDQSIPKPNVAEGPLRPDDDRFDEFMRWHCYPNPQPVEVRRGVPKQVRADSGTEPRGVRRQ